MKQPLGCPEIEQLAALAEGKISGAERDRILRHVNRCEDCYEILVDTLKFASGAVETAADVGRPQTSPWAWRRFAGWAIAAGVLLAVLIPLSRRGDTYPASGAFAEALQTDLEPRLLAAELIENLDSGRGFGPRGDAPRAAFRLGVRWIDLEVARSAEERIWVDRILREFERTVESVPQFSKQLEAVRQARRAESLSSGESATLAATLESIEPAHFTLGVWAESGRLAGAAKRSSLVGSPVFSEGISLARRLELPATAAAEVARIDGLVASGVHDPEHWEELRGSFSDLIQLLM